MTFLGYHFSADKSTKEKGQMTPKDTEKWDEKTEKTQLCPSPSPKIKSNPFERSGREFMKEF